jgi:transcriptional regulator with XRE-family HTH domain
MYQYKFADNLCRLCKERSVSIDALAERIGKSPRQISRYRNGQCQNIPLSVLEKIAGVLKVQVSELLE